MKATTEQHNNLVLNQKLGIDAMFDYSIKLISEKLSF